ncbi:hypothetical protein AB0D12_40365 [Streptomyces sp. NPDC048479]|uniref:hypothetical protein n=1 Tax=Streptomyces sp. NPDC048479 TaxID=3154725 RepID=UPI00342E2B96
MASDVEAFADSVNAVTQAMPVPAAWTPDRPCDDRAEHLHDALEDIGWLDLAEEPEALEFIASGAVELGRALAPLSTVDALLGGSPAAGSLVRYAQEGEAAVVAGSYGPVLKRISQAHPVAYADALAVHRFATDPAGIEEPVGPQRTTAWITANVGYLAGLCDGATRIAIEHADQRIAFGKPLTAIEAVAHKLADARTISDGLLLAAAHDPSPDVLAYAGPAACAVTAHCHQVVGAIGFTLEFPLQRYSRRAKALHLWNDSALTTLTCQEAA